MRESKHTPGPWLIVRDRSADRRKPIEVRAWNKQPNAIQGPLVCKIAQPHANRGEAFDNAALIAAAPDLLALLEKALPIIDDEAERRDYAHKAPDAREPYWTEMRGLANEIGALLTKAKGEQSCL